MERWLRAHMPLECFSVEFCKWVNYDYVLKLQCDFFFSVSNLIMLGFHI